MKVENNHRKYMNKEGNSVPSVTQILSVVAKPYLIPWANKLGLEGIKLSEYNEGITGIGTLVHRKIEAYLNGEFMDDSGYPEEIRKQSDTVFNKFLRWESENVVELMASEIPMSWDMYGGTLDAVITLNGVVTLIDWKTSKEIYPEYFSQLCAYHYLISNGQTPDGKELDFLSGKIEQIAVLQVPKEEGEAVLKTMLVSSDDFSVAFKYFMVCKELYNLKKKYKF